MSKVTKTFAKNNKKTSPYMKFCQTRRPILKRFHPNATFGEIGRMISEEWRLEEPDEEPKTPRRIFRSLIIDRVRELYHESIPSQTEFIIRTEWNELFPDEKQYFAGLEKRSSSSYINFCTKRCHQLEEEHLDKSFIGIREILFDEWENMSREEKDEFKPSGVEIHNMFEPKKIEPCDLFYREKRPEFKRLNPAFTFNEISDLLHCKWDELSLADQEYYSEVSIKDEYYANNSTDHVKKVEKRKKNRKHEDSDLLSKNHLKWISRECQKEGLNFICPDNDSLRNASFILHKFVDDSNNFTTDQLITYYIIDPDIRKEMENQIKLAVKRNWREIINILAPYAICKGIILDENIMLKIVEKKYLEYNNELGIFNMDVAGLLLDKITLDDSEPRTEIIDDLEDYQRIYCEDTPYQAAIKKILQDTSFGRASSFVNKTFNP